MSKRFLLFLLIIVVGWLLSQPHDPALRSTYTAIKRSESDGIDTFGRALGDL